LPTTIAVTFTAFGATEREGLVAKYKEPSQPKQIGYRNETR